MPTTDAIRTAANAGHVTSASQQRAQVGKIAITVFKSAVSRCRKTTTLFTKATRPFDDAIGTTRHLQRLCPWGAKEFRRRVSQADLLLNRQKMRRRMTFGNAPGWIHAAIQRAINKVLGFDLDIRLVSYGPPSKQTQTLFDEFSLLRTEVRSPTKLGPEPLTDNLGSYWTTRKGIAKCTRKASKN